MPPGIRGILVYCAVCLLGMVALGGAMKLAGLEMAGAAATVALFFALALGVTPVWTTATYATRSIWTAAWFHALHNVISQAIVPRTLGAGDELMLGESGVFPVAAYLGAAAIVLMALKFRWRDFAARHVNPA
jgi:hypothetical protein